MTSKGSTSASSTDSLTTPRAIHVSDPLSQSNLSFSSPATSITTTSTSTSSPSLSTHLSISETIKEYVTTSPPLRIKNNNSTTTFALTSFLNNCPEAANGLNEKQRAILAETLLTDLEKSSGWKDENGERRDCLWDDATRLLALKALKEVGRLPGGSAAPASEQGLRTLLLQLEFPIPSEPKPSNFWYSQPKSSFSKGGIPISHSHSQSSDPKISSLKKGHSYSISASSSAAIGRSGSDSLPPSTSYDSTEELSQESNLSGIGFNPARRPSGSSIGKGNGNSLSKAFGRRSSASAQGIVAGSASASWGKKISGNGNNSNLLSNGSKRKTGLDEMITSDSDEFRNYKMETEGEKETIQDSNLHLDGIDPFDSKIPSASSPYLSSNPNSNHGSNSSVNSTTSLTTPTPQPGRLNSIPSTSSGSRRPSTSPGLSASPYQSTLISKARWEITDTALRVLNNALFLQEKSRDLFVESEIGGGVAIVELLKNPLNVTSEILFLAGRLLFFTTLFENRFNKVVVEELGGVGRLVDCLFALASGIKALQKQDSNPTSRRESAASGSSNPSSSSGINSISTNAATLAFGSTFPITHPSSTLSNPAVSTSIRPGVEGTLTQLNAATSELLKAVFNLGLYYPRLADGFQDSTDPNQSGRAVAGESFHEALEPLLDPIIRLMIVLPLSSTPAPNPPSIAPTPPVMTGCPLGPPLTNVIACLLNFPVSGYREEWFGKTFSSRTQSKEKGKPRSAAKFLAGALFGNPFAKEKADLGKEKNASSSPNLGSSSNLEDDEEDSDEEEVQEPTLLNLATGEDGSLKVHARAPPVLKKLLLLLDSMLARYFSVSDPDSPSVKRIADSDGISLEEIFQPLLLLLRKLAAEDNRSRKFLREILLPPDIDREIPLDKRGDTTGRLVRLMSAVLLPQCARAAGELLLAICEGDGNLMTEEFGWGPCAGFLTNNGGVGNALPGNNARAGTKASKGKGPSHPNHEGRSINPITGSYNPTAEELSKDPINQLSNEEKEAEAEKMFTLFDRMNKTGIIKVKDPRENMMESGRFEEIETRNQKDEMEKIRNEELNDEEEVEKEMKAFRERKEIARKRAQNLARNSIVGASTNLNGGFGGI